MPTNSKHPETLVLHSGYRSDPATTAVAVPIYQTTSIQFRDTEHASKLFALAELGNIYSRIGNPTCDVLETRLAALEGGVAGLALGSGQAASLFAVQNICHACDNFVASTDLYGGTWNLFANTLKTMGIECRFVDPADPENFRRATDERTCCYYAETLPNPKLTVFPIAEVAKIGRELGVPLIMDNTAAPVLCRPLDHGAAIVLHSTTKYIGGHGTSIGGILIDGGNFDWVKHKDRFPMLNTPDPSYHGAVWTEAVKPLGPIAYIIKARVTLLRDVGAPMSPFNAFMFIQYTHAALWSVMALAKLMLIYRHRHKLPNAFIESAVNYQIGTGAEGGANAFVVDGRPFSENCGSIEIDLNAGIIHSYRFAFSPMLPVAVSASQVALPCSAARHL